MFVHSEVHLSYLDCQIFWILQKFSPLTWRGITWNCIRSRLRVYTVTVITLFGELTVNACSVLTFSLLEPCYKSIGIKLDEFLQLQRGKMKYESKISLKHNNIEIFLKSDFYQCKKNIVLHEWLRKGALIKLVQTVSDHFEIKYFEKKITFFHVLAFPCISWVQFLNQIHWNICGKQIVFPVQMFLTPIKLGLGLWLHVGTQKATRGQKKVLLPQILHMQACMCTNTSFCCFCFCKQDSGTV